VWHSVLRLLVTANVVSSSPILVTLMMEAIQSCEATILTGATGRHIPEDDILDSYRRESLKSYTAEDWLTNGALLSVSVDASVRR
jgi:hypothetical protein